MHIWEAALVQQESVPSVLETAATGEIAAIYGDIRKRNDKHQGPTLRNNTSQLITFIHRKSVGLGDFRE